MALSSEPQHIGEGEEGLGSRHGVQHECVDFKENMEPSAFDSKGNQAESSNYDNSMLEI
jgi:hypothetical protein